MPMVFSCGSLIQNGDQENKFYHRTVDNDNKLFAIAAAETTFEGVSRVHVSFEVLFAASPLVCD